MVKKFRRAAAGLEEQLPSDLRPPPVLKRTCDYLFNEVIGNAVSLGKVHHFVWDRTRAIRNDFSIQQITRPDELRIAIDCYERIARFHIVSLHQLALPEKPYSKYDWQQEREQLDRTLLSLMQYYDDSHGRFSNPNEAEFRAYCVIFQLQDPIPDLEDRTQTWPHLILKDKRVQKALDLYMAACNVLDVQGPLKPRASHLIAHQDWHRFWSLVASKEVSYLMACVAEIYFNLIRRTVLAALFRTSRANSSLATPDWTVDVLVELLAFDNGDQVYDYCEKFGFIFHERDDGEPYLDLTSVKGRTLPEPAAGIPKQSKSALVEDKRFGRILPAVINGLSVYQARTAGMVVEEEEEEEQEADISMGEQMGDDAEAVDRPEGRRRSIPSTARFEEEESLFIPEGNSSNVSSKSVAWSSLPAAYSRPISPFSSGAGRSTFGRPSGGTSDDNIPTSPNPSTQTSQTASTGAKFNFLQSPAPAAGAKTSSKPLFDFKGGINAGGSSEPKPAPATTTPSSLFDFTGTLKAGGSSESKLDTSETKLSPSQTSSAYNGTFSGTAPPLAQNLPPLFQQSEPAEVKAPSPERPTFPAPQSTFQFPSASSATTPKSTLTFGPPATRQAPEPEPPNIASQTLEVKSPQPQSHLPQVSPLSPAPTSPSPPTPPHGHHSNLSPISTGVRRPSSSGDNRPKKPSPLSNSITAAEEGAADDPGIVTPSPTSTTAGECGTVNDFDTDLERVASEFFYAPVAGVLDQYVRYHVSHTIREVKEALELEMDNSMADEFREQSLSLRFGRLWRALFWQQKSAKSGRERRQRRQRRLQERGSVETSSTADRNSVSSADGSVIRGGIEPYSTDLDVDLTLSKPPNNAVEAHIMKRPISSHGREAKNSSRASPHKRFKSTGHVDVRGRISKPLAARPTPTSQPQSDLLKRSAFLAFSTDPSSSGTKNTTSSTYFRLKAMGIDRLDKSLNQRGTKRRLSASLHSSAETSPPAFRTPSLASTNQTPKQSTISTPLPSSTLSRGSHGPDEDEALFARLRAAREGLTQSTAYYKDEVSRDNELRLSLNTSQSSNEYESPSMTKARADAKLRYNNSSMGSSLVTEQGVPAYRLRQSKFIPREQYGLAIERSREFRESRSREQSRPESRIDLDPFSVNIRASDSHYTSVKDHQNNAASQGKAKIANGFSYADSANLQSIHRTEKSKEQRQLYAPQPISFSNHTTKLTNHNPFLQGPTSAVFSSKNSAAFPASNVKDWSMPHTMDHTIESSKINEALANSFGESHGHGQNHVFSLSANGFTPATNDSYLRPQSISLLSDDEDNEETPADKSPAGYDQSKEYEKLQEPPDHALLRITRHSNPYADLAHDSNTDEEEMSDRDNGDGGAYEETDIDPNVDADDHRPDIESEDGSSSEDNAQDPSEEDYEEEYRHDQPPGSGWNDQADDEYSDMDAADGDIDEDGMEHPSEEEYDEEEEDYNELRGRENVRWAGEPYQAASPSPQGNAALQAVGNTEDDAIELSD